jgi:hypothetical protein
MILSIDPGDTESAYVLYNNEDKVPVRYEKLKNEELLEKLSEFKEETDILACEMIASYGMPVGRNVFETCVWIGRYWQKWVGELNGKIDLVYRKDVKMCLCRSMKAKDSNIRQAIMDRYGSTRERAIGKKKTPGPLYGMAGDMWAAMGVAIAYCEAER